MKARPQRDWAERAAARAIKRITDWPDITAGEHSLAKLVAAALRRAEKRGYQRGKSDGYAEGHEDQMKMRVLDTIERIDGKLAGVEAQAKLICNAKTLTSARREQR